MDRREVAAGSLFAAFGAGVVLYAQSYDRGTATQMGPGYFPTLLGIALVLLGAVALACRACAGASAGGDRAPGPFIPGLFVLAGVLAFAALVRGHGLVPAITAMVLLACYDRILRRPLEVAAICAAMLALAVSVFIYGIQLPLELW